MNDCGGELSGSNGILSFRQQPSYPVVCVWRITVKPGAKVQLFANTLTMPSRASRLRVLDGSNCGRNILRVFTQYERFPQNGIVSNSNTMVVVFTETVTEVARTNINAYFSEVIPEVTTTNGTGTTPVSSMKPTDGVIPEVTTTNGTGTTPIWTAPGSSMKPTNGATKAVNKFPFTFLVVIFICELLVPFE
ncbi:unnamed protein product [Dicrocoelium dendriticum]|nr:unnamed protein product [Dicrocoelium dendriticum]